MVVLITFLLLLLSVPLVFGSHQHREPSCNCRVTEDEDEKKKKSSAYKLPKKKKARKTLVQKQKKKSSSYKLLKKKRTGKVLKKEDPSTSEEDSSSSSSSFSGKVATKRKRSKSVLKPKSTKPCRASRKVLKKEKKPSVKKVEEDQVHVKLEIEEKDGEKVDFSLDVEVDPVTPGKEPLTTHLEGQVYWSL